ncbi:primosomal protein N' [Arthrobacter tumbae]|uniref:primosomal protein N' n=1 Tax=Arthrobacter tumbae TaxID=163874 RepID=UPI00195631BF|nr:primosomal protein N' [Arthrobacter tumbae]MBM7783197.1 primosomal protein N' (replication factor Y) [Arthrobacter tumbae]
MSSDDGQQLSLLQGFSAPAVPRGTSPVAAGLPVARVIIDSPLPHLDRPFDYLVPAQDDDAAVPGARVKVRFAGREHAAFILERLAVSDSPARLLPLARVVSGQPVASTEILALAAAVAARYAGSVSDVLRSAVPPRVARVEKEFEVGAEPGAAVHAGEESGRASLYARYVNGASFLSRLTAGESPRAVLATLGGYGPAGWPAELAEAVHAAWSAGRGAVVVVPDQRDLLRVEEALSARIGADAYVRLTAEDGPTPRYRNFLKLLHGEVRVAVGTRSAAYAPVRNLGLVCLWDDNDESHSEPRAPYPHAREVLLLRSELQGCALLIASASRSVEAQRLVDSGWAQSLSADRPAIRQLAPRVLHSADTYHTDREPLTHQVRIPPVAWRAARDGLKRGPVLIQVARTGFSPALACQDCREPARCRHCAGPLAQSGRGSAVACRWCGRPDHSWRCPTCSGARFRSTVSGAARTAEELGRAFPGAVVISSSGDHILDTVDASPRVVVATPGAEPVAASGYAAVVLLDGNALLGRESLRALESTLQRWFNAAVLARPASAGGVVVVTADDDVAAGHLVRWDPAGAAARELALRMELGLPPAVRYAALTGSLEALAAFLEGLDLPPSCRVVGPTAVREAAGPAAPEKPGQQSAAGSHRILVFFRYRDAADVVGALRARRVSLSARRTSEPVHVRIDPVGAL